MSNEVKIIKLKDTPVFFMYPCEGGYKYSGRVHTVEQAANDYAERVALNSVKACEEENYGQAFDFECDGIACLCNTVGMTAQEAAHIIGEQRRQIAEWRNKARFDGTMDALMHHTPISDYPAPRF